MPAEQLETKIARKTEGERHCDLPVVTAIVIRHGETTENKLDPMRGLTPEGEKQTDQAAEELIRQLDKNRDIIQLYDSGNFRANFTIMRIANRLKEEGFVFFEPIKTDKAGEPLHKGVKTTAEANSRKYKKFEAANIPDEFKKKLADPELHKKLGIPDAIKDKRVATWFLSEMEGMETPAEVAKRVYDGMEKAKKLVPMLDKQLGQDKRIVVLAAGNASMVDSVITKATGKNPLDRGGEIANCEGFKVDFEAGKDPKVGVWGREIEEFAR